MKPGPPGTPTALRILRGNKKTRINRDEPPAPSEPPQCPPDVSDEVREVWDYTLGNLVAMGIASRADRDALLCYCEAVVCHRTASKLLAESEPLIPGHRGVMVRNPAFAMQRDAAQQIRVLAHEFGLTPSARSDIRKGAASTDAPAARYLNA